MILCDAVCQKWPASISQILWEPWRRSCPHHLAMVRSDISANIRRVAMCRPLRGRTCWLLMSTLELILLKLSWCWLSLNLFILGTCSPPIEPFSRQCGSPLCLRHIEQWRHYVDILQSKLQGVLSSRSQTLILECSMVFLKL